MDIRKLKLEALERCYVKNKNIDSVKMMRKIREKLAIIYKNPQVEEKELEQIRKKYKIKSQ